MTGFKVLRPGDALLSRAENREVPSTLWGLASVFGMGTGVAPTLKSPGQKLAPGMARKK